MSKKAAEIREAMDVGEIAGDLVELNHPHLTGVRIRYLLTDGVADCKPKLLNDVIRYLSSAERQRVEDGDEVIVLVNEEDWDKLLDAERIGHVDHLLQHLALKVDANGDSTLIVAKHDVEAFTEVVRRRGAYTGQLRALVDAAGERNGHG